jgi:hypothetical protein
MNEDIISAFRPDQIEAATKAADDLAHKPMIVAKEFYHEPAERHRSGIDGSEAGRSRWKSEVSSASRFEDEVWDFSNETGTRR